MNSCKKNNKRFNLDSKKLRITSGFKNKLETLIHRIHNSTILYENLQIKEIHLHFEVKNSKSILKRVTLLLNLCLKHTLQKNILDQVPCDLSMAKPYNVV